MYRLCIYISGGTVVDWLYSASMEGSVLFCADSMVSAQSIRGRRHWMEQTIFECGAVFLLLKYIFFQPSTAWLLF